MPPAATTTVPEELLQGIRFLKIEKNKNEGQGKLHTQTVNMKVDPYAHILYWRYEQFKIFKEHELAGIENYIFLQDILDVRVGNNGNRQWKAEHESYNDNLFTVVSGPNLVHLEFTVFVLPRPNPDGLQQIADQIFQLALKARREEHGLLYHFRKKLSPKLYAAMVPRCSEEEIRSVFDTHGSQLTKTPIQDLRNLLHANVVKDVDVSDETLVKIITIITKSKNTQMDAEFKKLCDGEPTVSRENFCNFLRRCQHDHRLNDARFPPIDAKQLDALLLRLGYPKYIPLNASMFAHFVWSDECTAVTASRMTSDLSNMRQPITDYFIFSSHNTYCTGNQMALARGPAKAEVEIYRQALLDGCRCVELDVWDGRNGEPMITHGPTMIMRVNEISLKEVCEAIRDCAFKSSPYPVILSIENHLSKRQQKRMVYLFREIFGDLLLSQPMEQFPLHEHEDEDVLYPSPEDLKMKILVKARKREKKILPGTASIEAEPSIDISIVTAESAEIVAADVENEIRVLTSGEEALTELSEEERLAAMAPPQEEQTTTALSSIVNYVQAEKINFHPAKRHLVCSVDENFALLCLQNHQIAELQSFTHNKILRVYPKQSRIDSSNFNPLVHWLVGAQMVALNLQTNGNETLLNSAMFERNGATGYVRKPEFLRSRILQLRPFLNVPYTIPITVKVQVFGAYFLSTIADERYRGKSYVGVQLIDVPEEIQRPLQRIEKREKKRFKESHFVTNYGGEEFVFEKVMMSELSFLHFTVYTETGWPLAHRILHIDTMNNGFRHVILRTTANRSLGPASLFVRFDVHMHMGGKALSQHKALLDPFKFEEQNENFVQKFASPFSNSVSTEPTPDDHWEISERISKARIRKFISRVLGVDDGKKNQSAVARIALGHIDAYANPRRLGHGSEQDKTIGQLSPVAAAKATEGEDVRKLQMAGFELVEGSRRRSSQAVVELLPTTPTSVGGGQPTPGFASRFVGFFRKKP